MARPVSKEYRTAILGAFDRHTIRSIKEVNNHLISVGEFRSYQSTRRMLINLVKEGLLSELPNRLDKNTIQYTKLVFNSSVALVTLDGKLVTVDQFVRSLVSTEFPPVISPEAGEAIKKWMLDVLASAHEQGFADKRDIPDPDSLKKRLTQTLQMLQETHRFLKNFMESGAFSPVARGHLADEFVKQYPELHAALVEETWRSQKE